MGVARFIKAGIFPEEIPRKLFKRIECLECHVSAVNRDGDLISGPIPLL